MTPKRALEIAQSCFGNHPGALSIALRDIILAACAEERHAALNEAATRVDDAAQMPGLTHDQVIAIKGVALRVLALRDREQP